MLAIDVAVFAFVDEAVNVLLGVIMLHLRSTGRVVGVADDAGEVGEEQGPHPRRERPVLLVMHVQHEHGQHRRQRHQQHGAGEVHS